MDIKYAGATSLADQVVPNYRFRIQCIPANCVWNALFWFTGPPAFLTAAHESARSQNKKLSAYSLRGIVKVNLTAAATKKGAAGFFKKPAPAPSETVKVIEEEGAAESITSEAQLFSTIGMEFVAPALR
jgi:hypothetical protein